MTDQPGKDAPSSRWFRPLKPSGRASLLTWVFAMGAPAAIIEGIVATTVLSLLHFDSKNPQVSLLFVVTTVVVWIGALSVPVAAVLYGFDWFRAERTRKAERLQAAAAAQQAAVEQSAADERTLAAARTALAEIYAKHNTALAEEAGKLLAPDRYGRRDEQAAAREFAAFQDEVVEPNLLAQGFATAVVRHAFDLDRAELLRSVLASV